MTLTSWATKRIKRNFKQRKNSKPSSKNNLSNYLNATRQINFNDLFFSIRSTKKISKLSQNQLIKISFFIKCLTARDSDDSSCRQLSAE